MTKRSSCCRDSEMIYQIAYAIKTGAFRHNANSKNHFGMEFVTWLPPSLFIVVAWHFTFSQLTFWQNIFLELKYSKRDEKRIHNFCSCDQKVFKSFNCIEVFRFILSIVWNVFLSFLFVVLHSFFVSGASISYFVILYAYAMDIWNIYGALIYCGLHDTRILLFDAAVCTSTWTDFPKWFVRFGPNVVCLLR